MIGKDEVKKALGKKSAFGKDVDLEHYEEGSKDCGTIENLEDVSDDLIKDMMHVGINPDGEERDGSIMFLNNSMTHCGSKDRVQEGVVIMSTEQALEGYKWLEDFSWKSVDPTQDKFTAKAFLEDSNGYFIYVKPGHHLKYPIQACMMLDQDRSVQNLHNIIILGDNASLDMITGCSKHHNANDALHIGVSEIYIGENSSLTFSMVHSWDSQTVVRPRTNVHMKKNSRYVNNYFLLDRVGTVQSFPKVYLEGEGANCNMNTMCIAHENSDIDTGACVMHNAPNTGSEVVSRNISYGGRLVARGRLVGNAPGAKAHLECKSIVLKDGGITESVPELVTSVQDVDMTHEAAVGRIAQEQIEYLMSRGLKEDDAISMIVRGFLTGSVEGLPPNLKADIDAAVAQANLGD